MFILILLKIAKIIFWFFVTIIIYTYALYPLILYFLNFLKKKDYNNSKDEINYPEVTLVILAYNEERFIEQKVKNCNELIYPKNKLNILWVTDGSDDNSNKILEEKYNQKVLHKPERKGKINAMNRAVNYISTPIIIFTDANTEINNTSIIKIIEQYESDKNVGCVAGEKRIYIEEKESASVAGEGIYWKYESFIKNLESKLGSTIAAAGELFSIKRDLYTQIPDDTILDDLVLSFNVIKQGYKIKYTSDAYSYEKGTKTIKDELKRKIRIAAGNFQTLFRMPELLNFFKYRFISLEYISHKVLRWTLVPIAFPVIFIANIIILLKMYNIFFLITLVIQIFFYLFSLIGFLFNKKETKFKFLFIPFYILLMNFAMYKGFMLFLKKKQTVLWEKVERK